MNADDFDAKLRETQERAATAAEQGFGALTKSLQDVIALQTSEIARLRDIIEDATTTPERHAAEIAVTSTVTGSRERTDVLAKDNSGALWLLPNAPRSPYAVGHTEGWVRLPALPQPADEMDAAQPRRKGASDE